MREDGSDRASLAMPLGVCAVVAAVLALVAIAGASRAEPAASEPPGARAAASSGPVTPVATIARRVEAIRGLTFREMPEPKTVTKAQARREGLADLDRSYPTAERRADEELYKLLGLLAPRDDFREIFASIFGDQVAGYYDPRSGALRIVEGGAATNRVLDETTVAHELTHALEDQRFGLDLDDSGTSGDVPLAYTAMVEGTATALMTEYQRRHFGREETLGAAAAGALAAPSTQALPPFVTAQLLFPYVEGERFISRLYATARDSWRLVDLAERVRPPVSTEQILHPEKYLAVEAPERVRLPGVRRVLEGAGGGGGAWRRVAGASFGEWQTREWLARGGGTAAAEAAAGWGGDRYELWRRGPIEAEDCPAPCVERDALVMRWTWDTARDAAEFRAALDGALEQGLDARPRPGAPGEWAVRGGAAAVAVRGTRSVTFALAPRPDLARRLVRSR